MMSLFEKKLKIKNNLKKDAASKKGAGGDDQLVIFFMWPNDAAG